MEDQEFLTVAEFGRALDPPLTPASVRAAERQGRITAIRTASGMRLFTRAEAERFQRDRRGPGGRRKVA